MANVIIKTDSQKKYEERIMQSYGVDPKKATAEQRECAREISRHTDEIKKEMEANRI